MGNSRRGMDKKSILFCPHCQSNKVIRNGHPHSKKLEFSCKTCHKYFYEDTLKGYPPTNIPFPVIAYFLYFRKKIPEFSNMRKFRRFVNHLLQHLKISDQGVSRQTIHHWIKEFDHLLDRVITFEESRDYCQNRIKKLSKARPPQKTIPYRRALEVMVRKFGRNAVVKLIKKDEIFFKDLVDVISRHGVFSWEFLEDSYERRSGSQQSLAVG